MAKKTPVMSHDPLSDLSDDTVAAAADVVQDEDAQEASTDVQADEPQAPAVEAPSGNITLPESLTVAEVGELRPTLLAALESGASVVVDGSEVEMIDGAGMQLLAAVAKDATARNAEIDWRQPSVVLQDASYRLGMAGLLGFGAEAVAE